VPNFLLFFATSMAITLAPGPDNPQVLARGIRAGMIGGWLKRRPCVGVWLDRLAVQLEYS
jgi:threonine/homoserine/homoserine lactone efflux protein